MVRSSIGRRWSLAGSTFATGAFCLLFVAVESSWAVRATTVGLSLNSTIMWAVLYGWTPEIFSTEGSCSFVVDVAAHVVDLVV